MPNEETSFAGEQKVLFSVTSSNSSYHKVCHPSLEMSFGKLSSETRFLLRVTWTIPDFFRLVTESGYSLLSPDFAGGRYNLRLFRDRDWDFDPILIQLESFDDSDPGRAVSYEFQLKSRSEEIDFYRDVCNNKVFCLDRSYLEKDRDECVPDGTLTVLCSVRSREPGSAGWAQTRFIHQYRKTGNLSSESYPCLYVTWRIPAFFQPTWESECTQESPEFPFSDRRYRLRLVPCGSYIKYVFIPLVNLADSIPGTYVWYEVGLKSTTGEEIEIESHGPSTKRRFSIHRCELRAMRHRHFPDGHLTVFCCMRSREPSSSGTPKSGGAETSNEDDDKEAFPGGVAKLLSDYKRLLLKGAESDACLVVGGKEFQAHRNVLRARSPVFEAMFDHETAEKASGRVVIDDLKPDRFEDFLEYLYTGRVESFCDDNAFGLYAAADKYDVTTLKSECVEYMRRSLSVDNFCDVITMALRHHEQDLLEQAVEFFKKNVAGIILTVKWQQFMSENSGRANELFIKLLVPGRESENVLLP